MQTNRPTVEEEMLKTRSRASWEADRLKINGYIQKLESQQGDIDEELLRMYNDRIQYIDNVLDRHYTDMCIRCAHKNPKREYDSVNLNCMNCMKNIIYRVIAEMTDEERADFEERLDKQLEPKGE